jgi:hypothetical protein
VSAKTKKLVVLDVGNSSYILTFVFHVFHEHARLRRRVDSIRHWNDLSKTNQGRKYHQAIFSSKIEAEFFDDEAARTFRKAEKEFKDK